MRTSSIALAIACGAAVAWAGLVRFRGNFWNEPVDAHAREIDADREVEVWPRVHAVVPARNEADVIGESVASLAAQRYPGPFEVTVVDDHSTDGTAERVRAAGILDVVAARPLPPGWTGKLNALQSGVDAVSARGAAPDYWLFTDADIAHDPENVAELVAYAMRERLDLASLMVQLRCASGWERLLVPAFIFFFQKLYPFAWVRDERRRTAAAAGGCVLLSAGALERIGGLAIINDRLIDDCALADAVKSRGGRIWVGLTQRTHSIRAYDDLDALWAMVKRSAFTQLGHSYTTVALTVVAMLLLYGGPPAALIAGVWRRERALALAGFAGSSLMVTAYTPTLRNYGQAPVVALSLPLAATLYVAMTVDSALAHARKRGGAWKARTY